MGDLSRTATEDPPRKLNRIERRSTDVSSFARGGIMEPPALLTGTARSNSPHRAFAAARNYILIIQRTDAAQR